MTIQSLFSITASIIFIISYILITLEHNLKINKSGVSLFTAGILWILVAFSGISKSSISHILEKTGSEVFDIFIFLLAAMTLVEILINYNFFDKIRINLLKLNFDDKKQFIIISILTFFLSAFLNNITVGIVMMQIARRFFKKENLLIMASSIIVMANVGGAWSPLGDVTTIMIWLAGKFNASQIILYGFLPSLIFSLIFLIIMIKKIKKDTPDSLKEINIKFTRGEKLVITFALLGFLFPLIMNYFGLQPYIGLILGLGLVWIIIEFLQIRSKVRTHLESDIEILIKKVDFASLNFFIGILLSISALSALGLLHKLSLFLFGAQQEVSKIISGSIILGILSAIIDNVPLTAIGIDIIKTTDPQLWILFALTVGTGGSLLLVGSATGIVVMGIIKKLTFKKYFEIAFLPSLIGYFFAIGIWYIQYLLLH